RVISWLPMAHVAERNCSQYLPMVLGFSTTDCPDPRQVVGYLAEVPRWWRWQRRWRRKKKLIIAKS
ncbi:MAG TPA: hypothetical protein VLJ68_08285, partial [Chitinophagaceae bacterium]|nr:hypothetical protein [Chitinophagaceae bacterium]